MNIIENWIERKTTNNCNIVTVNSKDMWKRKPKHKTICEQEVRNLIFKLPGVDISKTIPADDIRGTLYPLGRIPDKNINPNQLWRSCMNN